MREGDVVSKKRSAPVKTGARHPKQQPPTPSPGPETKWRLLVIAVLLVVVTAAAYWQSLGCGFIDTFDDAAYVSKNPFVARGINAESIRWAFTTFRCTNWHPLTWLSLMVDYQLYGLDARGYHLNNLLFHVANALLLFAVLRRMTGAVWRSGFVAALFAVHPLHVESVAWVAERKDVLSTFFWLVTMLAYVSYARRPSVARYLGVAAAFGLGLMAKPMLVTLPIVLFLLDYWPLGRLSLRWRLVWEKLPLVAMSVGSCVITMIAQGSGGAVQGLGQLGFVYRIGNAAVSYAAYLWKMIWPARLAAFYPHPETDLPIWQAVGAGLALAVVTILVVRAGRRRPYLPVGWLWYLITLVPVIGLVQVGLQGMADRYTYMTMTGVFIIAAWGVPDLVSQCCRVRPGLLRAAAAVIVAILAVCTWFQVGTWRDADTLFGHASRVVPNNAVAFERIGQTLEDEQRYDEAIDCYSKAIRIRPRFAQARMALGRALISAGKVDEGLDELGKALRLGFDCAVERHNLACGYYAAGDLNAAEEQCRMALRLDPTYAPSENTLGVILGRRGRPDDAIALLRSALAHDPSCPDPHQNLAMCYLAKRDYQAAWAEINAYRAAGREPDPGLVEAVSAGMTEPR